MGLCLWQEYLDINKTTRNTGRNRRTKKSYKTDLEEENKSFCTWNNTYLLYKEHMIRENSVLLRERMIEKEDNGGCDTDCVLWSYEELKNDDVVGDELIISIF